MTTTPCNRDDQISPGGRPKTKAHLRVHHHKQHGQVWRRLLLCTEQGDRKIFSSYCQEHFERTALEIAARVRLPIRGVGAKFFYVERRRLRAQRRAVRELKRRTRLERLARLERLRKLAANARGAS